MRQRRVKPLLIGGYRGPHGTEEKRLGVAARVTFDQRGIDGTGENIRLDQNVLRELRLVRNDLQPGDRRAPGKRQISHAGVAKYSSLRRNVIELPSSTMSGTGSRR